MVTAIWLDKMLTALQSTKAQGLSKPETQSSMSHSQKLATKSSPATLPTLTARTHSMFDRHIF